MFSKAARRGRMEYAQSFGAERTRYSVCSMAESLAKAPPQYIYIYIYIYMCMVVLAR